MRKNHGTTKTYNMAFNETCFFFVVVVDFFFVLFFCFCFFVFFDIPVCALLEINIFSSL